jgi:phage gpG-like protein
MADVEMVKGTLVRLLERTIRSPIVILKRIGALLTSRVQKRFSTQEFDGRAWPPPMVPNIPGILSDLDRGVSVKSSRFQAGPALKDTGRLMASINWQIASEDSVEIGTNIEYAKFHQFGLMRVIPVTTRMKMGLMQFLVTVLGRAWSSRLSWVLGVDEFDLQIMERPFVGADQRDIDDVRSVVRDGILNFGK